MATRRDYNASAVEAARRVLVELVHILGEYRDHVVLVGGWVPDFLCTTPTEPHVGSIDIDLALDHRRLTDVSYRSIRELLVRHGYKEDRRQPFIFFRSVKAQGHDMTVEVDLLGGEYEGTGKAHRTQRVQDIRIRKARGADLAFDAPVEATVGAELPDGGWDRVTVRVASVVPFLVMKAMALADRLKEKDSYDIYYCLVNYPGGIEEVVEQFRAQSRHSLVSEGLQKLAEHFSSVNAVGPTHVANFEETTDVDARELICRDAFERVNFLLRQLGIG